MLDVFDCLVEAFDPCAALFCRPVADDVAWGELLYVAVLAWLDVRLLPETLA